MSDFSLTHATNVRLTPISVFGTRYRLRLQPIVELESIETGILNCRIIRIQACRRVDCGLQDIWRARFSVCSRREVAKYRWKQITSFDRIAIVWCRWWVLVVIRTGGSKSLDQSLLTLMTHLHKHCFSIPLISKDNPKSVSWATYAARHFVNAP